MSRPWSRAAPWPGHLMVDGKRYMLRPGQDGEMVARKATSLDAVQPVAYDYSALRPYVERPYNFGPLTGGMGEKTQKAGAARRCRYAIDADTSLGGVARLGPVLVPAVLPAVSIGEVRGFAQGMQSDGLLATFAFGQGGALRRIPLSETWVLSDDRTAFPGPTAQQAVRFRPSDASAPDALYVAYSDSVLRYFSSGTDSWATASVSVTIGARWIERVRDELHIWGEAASPGLSICTLNPLVSTNWSSPFWIGERSSAVTYLKAIDDQIFAFKQDGVYSYGLNAAGTKLEAVDLFPELRAEARQTGFAGYTADANGRHAAAWRGALWFGFGGRSRRLTPGAVAQLDLPGPSRLMENDSEVRGVQNAFAGDAWFGYYGLYNQATGDSYLCKHGTWFDPSDDQTAAFEFLEAVHGAVRKIAGREITALSVLPDDDAQPRLWVGYRDGGIDYAVLPKDSPDPGSDPACSFVTEGRVYWPLHHAMTPADTHHWRAFSATGPKLGATNRIAVEYRLTPGAGAWTDLGTEITQAAQKVTTPGLVAGAAVSQQIEVATVLRGDGTGTPEVEAVILHEQTRPALMLEHDVTVVAAENVARRDGSVDRRTGEQIRDALRSTAGPGPTPVVLPTGESIEADFVDYGEAKIPTGRSYGPAWDIPLKLIEFRPNSPYGTWDRAAAMDWDEAAAYDYDQALRW